MGFDNNISLQAHTLVLFSASMKTFQVLQSQYFLHCAAPTKAFATICDERLYSLLSAVYVLCYYPPRHSYLHLTTIFQFVAHQDFFRAGNGW